ncbi:hypothetical protein HX004_17660 [Myroides sp. 1354]|uniref:reverse transcriptase domain-containing protein n=1 Tax=Myroides sp. 1354 TaxID=2746734 RepID=UPI002577A814|nr:reverse transcriptase domain-containing protein [Myroides sp. 1354]MDM1057574.1 hypothetical protein [Myroides sp. 1354]
MHAMQDEYDSILKNDTWDLAEMPYGKKAIGTKWVYKLKRKVDGSIDRYKARLVAKGYAQQKGIDFDETFAPTSRMTTIRCIIALAAHHGWIVHISWTLKLPSCMVICMKRSMYLNLMVL